MSNETYRALIETVVAERGRELGITDASEAFENVANSLILEPYDLSIDEIEAGVTDGGGDGQIDAMYVIVNGNVLGDEDASSIPEKGPIEINIIMIQAKYVDGFEENPLKIIRSTVADLIDLTRD